MKIIDKLTRCRDSHGQCLSFEYYPPKNRALWRNFYEKIDRMSKFSPDFIDVTWGTGDPTSFASLELADAIQRRTGIDTMMHITCTHRSKSELLHIVSGLLRDTPIRNVMALRGNKPPEGPWLKHPEGFSNAAELVTALRCAFSDQIGISVAGYPEGHREDGLPPDRAYVRTPGYYDELRYLRQKVEAGADFIVTQLCFDLDQLCRYRDDCVQNGITCPIIPGLLPIHSHLTWKRSAAFSASIPQDLARDYALHSHDDDAHLDDFAIGLLERQIARLRHEGFFAIHLYTLNHERLISRWAQK